MGKVLMFFVDIPPFKGLGTSGGGLRAWSLYEGLKNSGFDVILSIPSFQYLSRKFWSEIDDNLKKYAWDWGKQNEIIKEVEPEVIIFTSNWGIVDVSEKINIPIAIDLHGPTLLEGYFSKGNMLTNEGIQTKIKKLSVGDFFIFVSERQKRYFASWLLMAGILLRKEHYGTIPVSLSPKMPHIEFKNKLINKKLVFVYAGGFYPWHDPTAGIEVLAETLRYYKRGELWLFTESHKISEADVKIFKSFATKLENNPYVKFRGLIPREELIEEYKRAHVALDLMSWNLERELAFTTRTVEYLWAGLPVIYNNYSELSEYIKRYKAGWCVDPDNPDEIRDVIEQMLDNPEQLVEYSANAQKLVRENFTWDKTIKPLVEFCKNPKKRDRSSDINFENNIRVSQEVPKRGPIERAILCYKEHGMKYTARKIIEYLKGDLR